MTQQVACIWRAPFTTVQPLAQLAPDTQAYPFAITPDGATLVGEAQGNDGHYWAVKWNTTTLAITALERVTTDACALGISSDGSVIVGCGHQANVGNDANAGPLIRWTGGGAAGSLLPPRGTGTTNAWWAFGEPFRLISDNGSTIVGADSSTPPPGSISTATKWINGVNNLLPGLGTVGTDIGDQAIFVSSDGSITGGQLGQHIGTVTNPQEPGYWVGTTMRRLVVPPESIGGIVVGNTQALFCNSDASIMWGDTPNIAASSNKACYWDNVTTLSGDGVHYGVSHIMGELPNTVHDRTAVYWVADDPSAHVAVGTSPSGAGLTIACKWIGTTAINLSAIDPATGSSAWGCNHDGTVVCGESFDTAFKNWPVRWDASNALHVLPTLADPTDSFQGRALGVSRDGSVIFGYIDVADGIDITPPPVPTPAALSVNLISLRWSDDRGHSWSSPVTQSMGEPGEYRTSLQWQRLGMARDRVFEISWSTPFKTALQGAWIDVTPAQS